MRQTTIDTVNIKQKIVKKNKPNKRLFLILPAIIFVAIVTQVPFIVTIILSFIKWIVVRPDLGVSFNSIANFAKVFTSFEFYDVIGNTLLLTFVSLALCTLLGIIFALLLDRDFPGVNIVRTLMIAPFFIMDSVIGIIWKTLILHPTFGFNGYIALWLNSKPIDFLGSHPLATVIILTVWQWTPFFVLVILAGLQGIPSDVIDSAKVDGANWFQNLIYVKLPMIANHIEVALILGSIFVLKVFGLIYVTTQGGPGFESTNLPYYVYKIGFFGWDVGKASALAVVTVLFTLVGIMALFKYIRKRMSGVIT